MSCSALSCSEGGNINDISCGGNLRPVNFNGFLKILDIRVIPDNKIETKNDKICSDSRHMV